MKQNPSRLKFRKNHKVSSSFFSLKNVNSFFLFYGVYALKSVQSGKLTFIRLKQVEKVLGVI